MPEELENEPQTEPEIKEAEAEEISDAEITPETPSEE